MGIQERGPIYIEVAALPIEEGSVEELGTDPVDGQ